MKTLSDIIENADWEDDNLTLEEHNKTGFKKPFIKLMSCHTSRKPLIGEKSYRHWIYDNEEELCDLYETFMNFINTNDDIYYGLFNDLNIKNFLNFMYNYTD